MRKFGVFAGIIFISIILGGLYGILHDEVTYSISPEYFTKFKYGQFGFEDAILGGDRQTVAVIGFLATWWVGLVSGLMIGLISLIYPNHYLMKKASVNAIIIVFITALFGGVVGFLRGKFHLTKTGVNWWFPDNLVDRDAFITVGSIHNYSYLGGASGIIIAVVYLFINNSGIRKKTATA